MPKKHKTHRRFGQLPLYVLGMLAVLSSFSVGMKTAGDVETISPMEASGTRLSGDVNGDGTVDVRDVIVILDIARGYRLQTADELVADPNHDGKLTIDDAIRILNGLSIR